MYRTRKQKQREAAGSIKHLDASREHGTVISQCRAKVPDTEDSDWLALDFTVTCKVAQT